MNCPWGEKALGNYLGSNRENWQEYDACELVKQNQSIEQPVLVDQGGADQFLNEQLKPELLGTAFEEAGRPLTLRTQSGYDHSYLFIASFIEDHIRFHSNNLG